MYRLRWQPTSSAAERNGSSRPDGAGSWLILGDGGAAADTLRTHLESHSQRCVLAQPAPTGGGYERLTPDSYRLDPAQPEHFKQLLEDAFTDDGPPCRGWCTCGDLLAAPPADTSLESLDSATTLGPVSVVHLAVSWRGPVGRRRRGCGW